MKVIDLLNKIANGEEVPKTIIYGTTLKYDEELKDYCNEYEDEYGDSYSDYLFSHQYSVGKILNEEVEVIEEDKKIEEIDMFDYFTGYDYGGTNKELLKDLEHNFETLNSKINEIIDKINKGE